MRTFVAWLVVSILLFCSAGARADASPDINAMLQLSGQDTFKTVCLDPKRPDTPDNCYRWRFVGPPPFPWKLPFDDVHRGDAVRIVATLSISVSFDSTDVRTRNMRLVVGSADVPGFVSDVLSRQEVGSTTEVIGPRGLIRDFFLKGVDWPASSNPLLRMKLISVKSRKSSSK